MGVNAARDLAAEYSAKAAAYTRHWAPVIGPMARPLLARLPLAGAKRVLDLGCGPGSQLDHLRTAAPGARVVGVDRSEGMLRTARDAQHGNTAVMDAQALAFEDRSFDVAVLAFMLFHLVDPPAALREVRRVLRADGAIGVVVWGVARDLPGVAIWIEELDKHGAGPDPRDAGVMHQAEMDSADKLSALLVSAGFGSVRAWTRRFETRWTVEALVECLVGCGMPGRRLASLPAPAQSACRARVEARLMKLTADDLVHRPEVVFGVARRADA